MLNGIKEVVVQYAEVISQITGVQVEIISRDFILMAGTHHIRVGSNVRPLSGIAAKTMSLKEPQTIEHPRIDPRCADCESKEFCRETMEITHPIIHCNEALGVITLFSLNEEERQILVKNLVIFQRFIAHIADLISAKAAEFQRELMNQLYSDTIMQIIDHIDRGVIILNPDSTIKSINASAHKHLGLTDSCIGKVMHWEYTGDSMLGEQEYAFVIAEKKYIVVGNHYPVHSNTAFETNVFIFQESSQLRSTLYSLTRKAGQHMLDEIIGSSPATLSLKRSIANLANSASTVLITGESGTGKELAARSIHQNGPRRERPFVPVNCGAIPPNLMESEFFGHVKGAFTGADQAKKGLMAEADGGTLFLDEVAELPLEMQVKLLRALQEEEVRRVGELSAKKVDLRIVAATNKDLRQEIEAGRFREDLFYRLNVINLKMPPLRERPDDIPMLAGLFLKQAVEKNGLPPKKLSPAAVRLLSEQKWVGNVRALKNAIEQGAVMSEGEVIAPDDFPFAPATVQAAPEVAATRAVGARGLELSIPEDLIDLKTALKEVTEATERIIIGRVLKEHGGNRTHTAEALGLSRRALITKVQAYGLD